MSSIPAPRPTTMPARQAAPAARTPLGLAPMDPLKILRKYKWWLGGSLIVGAVFGLIGNEAIKQIYPSWRSEVVYQCLPMQQDPTKQINVGIDNKDEMERFLLTQSSVMNSDRVYRQALIDSEPVFSRDTKWGKRWTTDSNGKVAIAKGLKQLKKIANASVVYGTSMIRLTVTTQDPDDSAAIAKAIHDSYWKDWKNLSAAIGVENRGPLERRENDLRAEILRMDSTHDKMMLDFKIDDIKSVKGPAADRMIDEATHKLADAVQLRESALSTQRQYEEVRNSGPDNFPNELKDAVERDQSIVELRTRVAATQADYDSLGKLGPEHQRKIAAKANLDSLNNELANARSALLHKLFDGELDRVTRQVESANNQITQFTKNYNEGVARKQEISRVLSKFELLDKDRDRLQAQLTEVQGALSAINLTVNVTAQDRIDRIRILNPATAPDTIFFPKLEVMIPLGIVLTFGLTAGLLFLRELLDQRVKSPADIHSIPRTRLIGGVPTVEADPTRPTPETALRDAPTGAIADSYRQARAAIAKRMGTAGYKSLLVCSGMPQSGATSAAANLALGAAGADQRVLLIDANFRRPNLHRVFKLGEGPGLGEVLAKKATLDTAIQATNTPNLHLLAAGTAANRATPERLSTELMSQVIQEASGKYDLVIIDAAPAGIAGDAMALANRVDATLLVVRALGEKRGLIARLRDTFNEAHGEFLGVLVNRVPPTGTGYMAKNIRAAQEYQATAG